MNNQIQQCIVYASSFSSSSLLLSLSLARAREKICSGQGDKRLSALSEGRGIQKDESKLPLGIEALEMNDDLKMSRWHLGSQRDYFEWEILL